MSDIMFIVTDPNMADSEKGIQINDPIYITKNTQQDVLVSTQELNDSDDLDHNLNFALDQTALTKFHDARCPETQTIDDLTQKIMKVMGDQPQVTGKVIDKIQGKWEIDMGGDDDSRPIGYVVQLSLTPQTKEQVILKQALPAGKVNIYYDVQQQSLVAEQNRKTVAVEKASPDIIQAVRPSKKFAIGPIISGQIKNRQKTINLTIDQDFIQKAQYSQATLTAMQKVLDQNILSVAEVRDRLLYLKQLIIPVEDALIQEIFATMIPYSQPDVKAHLIQMSPDQYFVDNESGYVRKVLIDILNGDRAVRLVGDKATGKNTLADTIGWLLNRPVYTISLNGQEDKESLIGERTLNDQGQIVYDPSDLVRAYQYGGIAVLDEINAAPADVLFVLQHALDDHKSFNVEGLNNEKTGNQIVAHPNTVVIATMNEGYEGTKDLNEALHSRFTAIRMQYKKGSILRILKHKFPQVNHKALTDGARFFEALLANVQSDEWTADLIDLRGLIEAFRLLNFYSLREALEHEIVENIDDPEARNEIQLLLEQKINFN